MSGLDITKQVIATVIEIVKEFLTWIIHRRDAPIHSFVVTGQARCRVD